MLYWVGGFGGGNNNVLGKMGKKKGGEGEKKKLKEKVYIGLGSTIE